MRWTAYIDLLTDSDQAQLINALTLGWGYARMAARLADADRATAVILAHIDEAELQLTRARRLLTMPGEAPPATVEPRAAGSTQFDHTSWQEFLLTLTDAAAAELERSLADAVVSARRAALVAQEDGEVEMARREVDSALAAFARVCSRDRNRRTSDEAMCFNRGL
jgi:hypothetical protein